MPWIQILTPPEKAKKTELTWEGKAWHLLQDWGQPGLHSKLQVSLGYRMKLCLKANKNHVLKN